MKEKENINANKQKLESKDLKTGTNTKEIKLDSHGDEIMYEVRHRLGIQDTIQYIIMFMFGIALVYAGIKAFVLQKIDIVIISMILGIPCGLSSFYRLFYARKDRFYVTNNGIGFEYRHWFRMHKRFFKFGEVGLALFCLPAPVYFDSSKEIFIIHPINITYKLMAFPRLRDKNYKHYIFCKVLTELYHDDIKAILVFIRQKTKEALESQGIEISDSELKDKFKHLLYKDI